MKKIYFKKPDSKLDKHLGEFLSSVHNGILAFGDYDGDLDEDIRSEKVRILCDDDRIKTIAAEAAGILDVVEEIAEKDRNSNGEAYELSGSEAEVETKYLLAEDIPEEDRIPPELDEKLEIISFVSDYEQTVERGEEPDAEAKKDYEEQKDIALTSDEKELLDRNRRAVEADAVKRVGASPYNVFLIQRAKRYWKLSELVAPELIRYREAHRFFEYYMLHRLFQMGEASFVQEDNE